MFLSATLPPPQQLRRLNEQILTGFAVATSLSVGLWFYLRSPTDQTVQQTEQDPNQVDQVLKRVFGDLVEAIEAFGNLVGLGANSELRMLLDFCQPILFLGNAQGNEMALHTELHRFERMGLPADRPSLVALLWQIPPVGNGDPDQIVPVLAEILKHYEEEGAFEIPGYAVAMTQWRSHLIIWEYKAGRLEEVRRFAG